MQSATRLVILGLVVLLTPFALGASLCAHQDHSGDGAAIINKSIEAMGGTAKLMTLEKLYSKANTRIQPDLQVAWETWIEIPERSKQVLKYEFKGRPTKLVCVQNNEEVWIKSDDSPTKSLPKDKSSIDESISHRHLVRRLYPLLDKKHYSSVSVGEVVVENKKTDCVRVVSGKRIQLDLFFDKDTALLTKCTSKLPEGHPNGKILEHYFYNYREIDGLKYAMKTTTKTDGRIFMDQDTIVLRTFNEFPKETFVKPK